MLVFIDIEEKQIAVTGKLQKKREHEGSRSPTKKFN